MVISSLFFYLSKLRHIFIFRTLRKQLHESNDSNIENLNECLTFIIL
jgi:hypothetical protein